MILFDNRANFVAPSFKPDELKEFLVSEAMFSNTEGDFVFHIQIAESASFINQWSGFTAFSVTSYIIKDLNAPKRFDFTNIKDSDLATYHTKDIQFMCSTPEEMSEFIKLQNERYIAQHRPVIRPC